MRKSFILICLVLALTLISCAESPKKSVIVEKHLSLELGPMADYGASPWFTQDISIGVDRIKLSPDTGAAFIWATSDLCHTPACNAHEKVDTTQPGFRWTDTTVTERSFGPWGTMYTKTGDINFTDVDVGTVNVNFFASVNYTGPQFEFLAWSGGIGFPATSKDVTKGSDFYFKELLRRGQVDAPEFSMVTNQQTQKGIFVLGSSNNSLYDPETEILLEPNTSGLISYIWGTDLYSTTLGGRAIASLSNARFYLDSGSSLFKGDNKFITPILGILYETTDANRQRIFEKVVDSKNNWVSLVYRNNKGPQDFPRGTLPDLTLTMGQSCNKTKNLRAQITLSPTQYSYYVEVGERQGSWVPAFSVLNGVGGLLVGSTFMDLFYTTFQYREGVTNSLTQGNMYLYKTIGSQQPSSLVCVPL